MPSNSGTAIHRLICALVGHKYDEELELQPRIGPAPRPVKREKCQRCGWVKT